MRVSDFVSLICTSNFVDNHFGHYVVEKTQLMGPWSGDGFVDYLTSEISIYVPDVSGSAVDDVLQSLCEPTSDEHLRAAVHAFLTANYPALWSEAINVRISAETCAGEETPE